MKQHDPERSESEARQYFWLIVALLSTSITVLFLLAVAFNWDGFLTLIVGGIRYGKTYKQ